MGLSEDPEPRAQEERSRGCEPCLACEPCLVCVPCLVYGLYPECEQYRGCVPHLECGLSPACEGHPVFLLPLECEVPLGSVPCQEYVLGSLQELGLLQELQQTSAGLL